jgi:ankyrin repeat protein
VRQSGLSLLKIPSNSKSGDDDLLSRLDTWHFGGVLDALKLGADCHVTNFDGNGPLHIAVRNRASAEILDALAVAGADPGLKNRRGETPLHLCRSPGGPAPRSLLAAGADIEARDNMGQTWFFHQAGSFNLKSCVELGARLDTRD